MKSFELADTIQSVMNLLNDVVPTTSKVHYYQYFNLSNIKEATH